MEAPRQAARPAAARTDFARWLTSDLRIKGSTRTVSEAPRAPTRSLAVNADTPSAQDGEKVDFARWLTADLRPRQRYAPDSLAPQVVSTEMTDADAAPDGVDAFDAASEERLTAAGMTELPNAVEPLGAAGPQPKPELDDDDLAVLPGRARRRAQLSSRGQSSRGRRGAVGLALLLLAGGALWLGGERPKSDLAARASAAPPAGAQLAALPPPPPDEVPAELEPEPEPSAAPEPMGNAERRAASAPRKGGAAPEPNPELDALDAKLSRARRPNVARYPDLPSPTLSQLARQEQATARKDAVRSSSVSAKQ